MGLFSSIFGGSTKQTATQKTTVNTQVDVANAVTVSTEEIAKVLKEFGLKVNQAGADTKALIQKLGEQNAIDLISRLQFVDLLRRRTKQAAIIGGAGLFGWWYLTKKKGRKK